MKQLRKISLLLAIALLLSISTTLSAVAETPVAKIGDTTYATIADAVTALNALENGGTLELLANADAGTTQLCIKKPMALKGNGFTLTSANSDYIIVLENDIGAVSVENITINATAGGIFKIRQGVQLTVESNISVSSKNVVFLFTGASNNTTALVKGGTYVSTSGIFNASASTSRSLTIEGGTYTISGGNLLALESMDTVVKGGIFTNNGVSRTIIVKGTTNLTWYNGTVYNNQGSAEVMSFETNGNAVIYDGYFCNNASGRCLSKGSSSNASSKSAIEIYGGTYVVKNTGACCRSDDANRPIVVYGGAFFNYGNDWTVAGTCTLKGGYLFATKNVNNSGAVTEANALKDGDGNYIKMDGLYVTTKTVPVTVDGASARLVTGSNGIRFESDITKATLDYAESLKDADTTVSYGTVICPTDYLTGYYGMSMSTLTTAGKTYQNIVAKDGVETDSEGNVHLRAALVDLQEGNESRDMSAVSYVSYVKNGVAVYIYSLYRAEANSRSMATIATAALADLTTVMQGDYQYAVGDKYSPYSPEQRLVLQGYLAQ